LGDPPALRRHHPAPDHVRAQFIRAHLDHLGILLAERLLGITVESASRITTKLPPDSVVTQMTIF